MPFIPDPEDAVKTQAIPLDIHRAHANAGTLRSQFRAATLNLIQLHRLVGQIADRTAVYEPGHAAAIAAFKAEIDGQVSALAAFDGVMARAETALTATKTALQAT
jgi:hypothetical protein